LLGTLFKMLKKHVNLYRRYATFSGREPGATVALIVIMRVLHRFCELVNASCTVLSTVQYRRVLVCLNLGFRVSNECNLGNHVKITQILFETCAG
jgi:hypothetical protein